MEKVRPHFLFCYDGSYNCKKIWNYLRALFEGASIEISFLHFIEIPSSLTLPRRDYLKEIERERDLEAFCEERRAFFLKRWEEELKEEKMLQIKPHFYLFPLEGDKSKALLDFLQTHTYTAVLMGKRGLGRLATLWTGSLTQKVLLYSNQPIWIIRNSIFNRKILLAFDISEEALKLTRYTANLLKNFKDFELTFLHIQSPHNRILENDKREVETCINQIKDILISKEISLDKVNFMIKSSFLGPTYGILKECKKGDYATVIIGKRGRGGFPGLLLGSVATKLLNILEDRAIWLIP